MTDTVYIYDRDREGAEFHIRRSFAVEVGDTIAREMSARSKGRFLVVLDFAHFDRTSGAPFFCSNHDFVIEMAMRICGMFEMQQTGALVRIQHRVANDALPTIMDMLNECQDIAKANAALAFNHAAGDEIGQRGARWQQSPGAVASGLD